MCVCVFKKSPQISMGVWMPGDPLAEVRVQQRLSCPLKSFILRNL